MSEANDLKSKVARRSPRQKRAKATIEAIQQATIKLLQQSEFDDITTNDIARIAGVSIGSLYQYFRNKEEILASLIFYFAEKFSKETVLLIDQHECSNFHEFVLDISRHLIGEISLNSRPWKLSFEHNVRSGHMANIPRLQAERIELVCDCIYEKFGPYLNLERQKYHSAIQLIAFQVAQSYMGGENSFDLEEIINNTSALFLKIFEWNATKSLIG